MFVPNNIKIDIPNNFKIERLTIFFDFDVEKLKKLIESVTVLLILQALVRYCLALNKPAVLEAALATSVVLIVGTRYCLAACHRLLNQPAVPEAAPAPEIVMAISNISHMRKVFPENYFNHKSVPDLEMTIKKLMRKDAESSRMIDWMEKGVNDALKKERLKTLLFCVCETVGGAMIEEYAFSFSYPNSEITPNQMRSSLCQIGALILLIGTLDEMPEERTIVMKLLYYENVTPKFYEPPCFKRCTEEEFNNPWTKNPLKWKVGNVNSKDVNNKPLVFALEVKSVLYDSLGAGCVEVDASVLKTEPAASRGMAQVMEFARTNDRFKGESSSHCKRSRKASIVKEPILLKAQVA